MHSQFSLQKREFCKKAFELGMAKIMTVHDVGGIINCLFKNGLHLMSSLSIVPQFVLSRSSCAMSSADQGKTVQGWRVHPVPTE